MSKKESFLSNRIKSIGYAFKGAYLLITTENSIKIQFCIGILMTILGFIVNLSATEWMIQILTIGLIMSVEGLNTAIEETLEAMPERTRKIFSMSRNEGMNDPLNRTN